MRHALTLLAFLLLCTSSFAQNITELRKVDSLINIPDLQAAKTALRELESGADDGLRIACENRTARILIIEGNLNEATDLLGKLSSSDPYLSAITHSTQGFLFLNKSRQDLALEKLEQAWAEFQQGGKSTTDEAALCLSNLGLVYLTTGKFNQALEFSRMALTTRLKLHGAESEEVAAAYNDLGLVLSQSDPDAALEYYDKALAIYQKYRGNMHPKIAIANTNMGFIFLGQKLYGDAINNLETAESIWKSVYPNGHPNQALALTNLGRVYAQMGNTTAANGYFRKAVGLYHKTVGNKHPDLSFVYNQMGLIKQSDQAYDSALYFFQEALIANAPTFNNHAIATNPSRQDAFNQKVLLYALRLKAEALEARHYGKTLSIQDLRLALQVLHSCDTLLDEIRNHSTNEADKLELGNAATDVFESGVRVTAALSEMSLKPGPYREEAFYFAEKSKSAVLQQSIADAEAKSFAGIPPTLLNEEKQLKAELALLNQQLSQTNTQQEGNRLREQLFRTNETYRQFTQKLEKDFPDYFNLKFNTTAPSVAALQHILAEDVTVVSYFVSEHDQQLYTFVLSKDNFKMIHSKLPDDFDRLVKGFNNSLYYSVFPSYQESADRLSQILLRGLTKSIKKAIVIPSGRLSTLPFEALPVSKLAKADWSTADYLIKHTAISYEFSAGLLLQKKKIAESNRTNSIFLCAPLTFDGRDNLSDLPGTRDELRQISTLFGNQAKVIQGTEANESAVKSGDLRNYRFVHFATHGIVDEVSPELSRIYLQSGNQEDGNLFSGEIFNLQLQADLAVLSACQTGLGKFSKGEGVIGLSRALVYAGANSLVVSYWSVADQSTSQLMTSFYEEIMKSPTAGFATSLQRAKLAMINQPALAAPYYWAPFVLIGK
ncbi:MAG TPA: CHAT domain-containing protein [Cyclobacteriaceae bacterium]|nr:CHAT domain-containing protein [Cyclobacteriaceae bacterium]